MNMWMFHSKRRCAVILALSLSVRAVFAGASLASDAGGPPARFERSFGAGDFKTTQDALKYEIPENGRCKVIPRSRNGVVWTRFALPEDSWKYKEWSVTASVNSSEGSGAGVGMWNDDEGCTLTIFPDGRGVMQYYEGRRATWSAEVRVANFAYPARISLERDINGSVIGRVNTAIVAVKLEPADLKKTELPPVKSVSFSTHAPAAAGRGAVYDGIDVRAWGLGRTRDLFGETGA
jgi:hypothetical protein